MSNEDQTITDQNEQLLKEEQDTMLYQILTGVFAGLALILMGAMIWLLIARQSGRSQPAQSIQGGFSLGALGSLMSTE